ncbi:MAG: hypothetical protein AAF674_16435 [Pseudomonadota bacterium]
MGTPDGTGLSLREAIGLASAASEASTISFAPTLTGQTIELTEGVLQFAATQQITIAGDVTVDAASRSGVLEVISGAVILDGLTITRGSGTEGAGANVSGGSLTVANTTFTSNSASSSGGAIAVSSGANLDVVGSSFCREHCQNNCRCHLSFCDRRTG